MKRLCSDEFERGAAIQQRDLPGKLRNSDGAEHQMRSLLVESVLLLPREALSRR
jgi:hypothetical protein